MTVQFVPRAGGVRAGRVALTGLCLAILAACATTRGPMTTTTDAQWADRQDRLRALEEWELRGRISLSTKDDALSGTLTWRQLFGVEAWPVTNTILLNP